MEICRLGWPTRAVCDLLRVDAKTLRAWQKVRLFPRGKLVGRDLLWSPNDLEKALGGPFVDRGRLLSMTETAARVGVSPQAVSYYPARHRGFPRPVRIGPRFVRWWEKDVEAWLAGR